VSKLYPGVTHHRTMMVLRQGLVLVRDELSSSASHEYSQTWHLAPNATPSTGASAENVTALVSGKPQLQITQASPSGMTLQSFDGATDPMQGWYSSGYGFKQPSWALQFERHGTNASFATLLAAGPYASQDATVTEAPGPAADVIDVCVGGVTGYEVTVPHQNEVAPTIVADACPGG
jgi:hypothetical protein